VSRIFEVKKFAEAYTTTNKRRIGVEVELEEVIFAPVVDSINPLIVPIPRVESYITPINDFVTPAPPRTASGRTIPGWSNEKDGSLRGSNAFEFKTAGVTNLTNIGDKLNALTSALINSNDSIRTSVHVHIDARDFTLENLKVLLLGYCILEQVFFAHIGSDRKENFYCTPIQETNMNFIFNPKFKHTEFRANNIQDIRIMLGSKKYQALNLEPLLSNGAPYGTIEFRGMEGGLNVERILKWITTLVTMFDRSVKLTWGEVEHVLTHKIAVFRFISMYLGNDLAKFYSKNTEDFNFLIKKGLYYVREGA
jgi:hypothetical protein